MTARKSKATINATVKPTIVDVPFVDAQTHSAKSEESPYRQYMHRMLDDHLNNETVSIKRVLIAWTVSLAASFGVGYIGGLVITYAVVGAALLSGSAFLSLMIYLVGILATVYAGAKVGEFLFSGVITEKFETIASHAYTGAGNFVLSTCGSVRNLFNSKVVTA